ncbi:uncharacterized protein LOC128248023 [Octopus bimaculoides]|uniref:uncharacterized protein LOC128248023 n=1 Tax=Octopus bimaculoides TaxID=37653 RepID=UPI0022E6DA7C|nr:uncharacterized protein LOC128248023 [Octopus bimaculoides]
MEHRPQIKWSVFILDITLTMEAFGDSLCGPEPEAVVHGLKVNQGYFFRVTVWKDPVNQLYGNITEAVYAKTKAGCIFQGKTYQVGQLYEVNCEDICKCMSDGKFACEPVCPEERHNPKINNPLFKCTRELIGQSECCYATVCEPIDS